MNIDIDELWRSNPVKVGGAALVLLLVSWVVYPRFLWKWIRNHHLDMEVEAENARHAAQTAATIFGFIVVQAGVLIIAEHGEQGPGMRKIAVFATGAALSMCALAHIIMCKDHEFKGRFDHATRSFTKTILAVSFILSLAVISAAYSEVLPGQGAKAVLPAVVAEIHEFKRDGIGVRVVYAITDAEFKEVPETMMLKVKATKTFNSSWRIVDVQGFVGKDGGAKMSPQASLLDNPSYDSGKTNETRVFLYDLAPHGRYFVQFLLRAREGGTDTPESASQVLAAGQGLTVSAIANN